MLVFKVVHVYLNIHICTDSLCPTWIKSGSFAVRVSETTLPTLHHLVIANSLWLRCLFFAWPSWGHLWASWGHLGASLGPSWAIGAILGPSWGHLGASWGHVVPSWGHLGPSWDFLGPSWGHLGAILGHLGASWGHLGSKLGGPGGVQLSAFGGLFELLEPSWLQDGSRWPKMVPRWPSMAPRWPKMAPKWPQEGPKMGPTNSPRQAQMCSTTSRKRGVVEQIGSQNSSRAPQELKQQYRLPKKR